MRANKTAVAVLAAVSAAALTAAVSSAGLVKSAAEVDVFDVHHQVVLAAAMSPQWVDHGSGVAISEELADHGA